MVTGRFRRYADVTATPIAGTPVVGRDPLDIPGVLSIYEPGSVMAPLVGAPTNGATIPNLAYRRSSVLVGGNGGALITENVSTVSGIAERTPKGGIHAGIPTTATAAATGFRINEDVPTVAYAQAHPTNDYYLSVWSRATRAATTVASITAFQTASVHFMSHGTTQFFTVDQSAVRTIDGTTTVIDHTQPTLRASGKTSDIAAGFASATTSTLNRYPFVVGNIGYINDQSSKRGLTGARIFYRSTFIDLTAAGLTYAQVYALDLVEFNAAFGTGGRYAGDAPTTAPPA